MNPRRPVRRRPVTMRAAALSVARRLKEAGHVALFAGGCVRDMLMGKRPHDYDVAVCRQLIDEMPGECRGASWLVDGVDLGPVSTALV